MDDDIQLSYLDERLCFALYSSSQAIIKKYKHGLAPLGLTYPQYLVYLALEPETQMSVGDLGQRLYLDSGTLSPLLQRMQKAGWVERVRSQEDERKVMLTLTDKARAIKPQIAALQREVSCATELPRETFLQLLGQLQSLNHTLRQRD